MEYKLIVENINVELLHKMGYFENLTNTDNLPIHVDDDGEFEAIKCLDDKKIAITMTRVNHQDCVRAYQYVGNIQMHKYVSYIDPKPYIQDLIDAKMVNINSEVK